MIWLKYLNEYMRKSNKENKNTEGQHQVRSEKIFSSFEENMEYIQKKFNYTEDLKKRDAHYNGKRVSLFYVTSLVDKELLQKSIMFFYSKEQDNLKNLIQIDEYQSTSSLNQAIEKLLEGYCLILEEGSSEFLMIDVRSSYVRTVDEPNNEKVIRGPHDGFVEDITINLHLVRKRIKNSELTVRRHTLGKQSKTTCAIVYLNNLANPEIIKKVEKRLQAVEIDSVNNSGVIEELLGDSINSPFPQILNTERPDRVASNIVEGRVAVLIDGTPGALILPVTFFAFFQSVDDFSSRWLMSSFYRLLRLLSFIIATTLPAIYIAIISFHSEVIPKGLILLVKRSVEEIPYPPIIEAFLMELTLELLREAGVRLPSPIGQTIGIVGGLVIGDAVVRAGLVSNIMIIVVALTAISSFILPAHEMSTSIRLIRFPLMLASATLGFVGLIYGLMFLFMHLCRLHSFGTPYLSPFAPLRMEGLEDTFVRLPITKQKLRPRDSQSIERTRVAGQRSKESKDDESK